MKALPKGAVARRQGQTPWEANESLISDRAPTYCHKFVLDSDTHAATPMAPIRDYLRHKHLCSSNTSLFSNGEACMKAGSTSRKQDLASSGCTDLWIQHKDDYDLVNCKKKTSRSNSEKKRIRSFKGERLKQNPRGRQEVSDDL
jgi:hypothetical protein